VVKDFMEEGYSMKTLSKGWKRLLLLSIVGGLVSIVMLSCKGGDTTKEGVGITISPKQDEIPANGTTRFIAYNEGSRQRANVRWHSLDREAGYENDIAV